MIARLPIDEKHPEKPRADLDRDLDVASWRVPGQRAHHTRAEPGAPSWWHGDEDASQGFLATMGVRLGG